MNGIDFLADTNILLYVHEGNPSVEPFLNFSIATSFVTEIELLGWYKISESDKKSLRLLLDDCTIMELTPEIKNLAIEIKQRNKIKLPDALIASTAITLQIPLVTADQDFKKVNGLEIIWVDPANP